MKLRFGRVSIHNRSIARISGALRRTHPVHDEPHVGLIQGYARDGLSKTGHHGVAAAMGVPRDEVPSWDDIQFITAQLHRVPLLDDGYVNTSVTIGPGAQKPLKLEIPLFVSDMSFGALSREAKIALSKGAELAGTGICAGEGGSLDEERHANSRYFYELASACFEFSWDKVRESAAFHFKGGQGAKTGTAGHLPGAKVTPEIAKVRGLSPGEDAISPPRFPEWDKPSQFRDFADEVRHYRASPMAELVRRCETDMAPTEQIVIFFGGYVGIGAVVAILFLVFGISRIDHAAKGASFLFRPTIFLGCALLWPYIIVRFLSQRKINLPTEGEK